jgi:uncharacterized membrane protein YoaK (UPF0700 family)
MQERAHHPSGPLALAVVLAGAAGFVDAHIYVNVTPVFVANMSGNLVHLGIFAGDGDRSAAVATLVALGAFTLGVIGATLHHDRRVARRRAVHPAFLLAVESAMLAGLTAWLILSPVPFTTDPRAADLPVLALAAVAMGLQAGALRRVGEIAVATTYGTGAIVRIGEKVALAARRADRPTVHRRRVAIAVLVVVLVSYVAGATSAAVAGASPWLLCFPTAALIGSAVAIRDARDASTIPPDAR